jgi:hypothetical protein
VTVATPAIANAGGPSTICQVQRKH